MKNKLFILPSFLFFITVFCLSCEKQSIAPEPLTLSEYIIGDWEARAAIDASNYNDFEYHDFTPPYAAFYRFKENGTYEVWLKNESDSPVPFKINERDSTLTLNHIKWKLHSFSEEVIDMRRIGRHGLDGKKLFKLE